ncbi:hypothetical protein MTO96_022986 [Rhipicephalus appendiculatus]
MSRPKHSSFAGGTGKTCPSLFPIPNGVVDVPPGKQGVNSKAEYRCNTGYKLVGVAERVCQADGTWSGQEPHCQPHGDVTVEPGPIHVNTRAEYRCDVDYTLIGDKERFCQLNGTWSGKEPICHDANADTCPAPPPIPNGAIDVAPGPIVVRTRIEYRCHAGYALLGQSERFCQLNGSWTGSPPVCEANCPAPSAIANGDVSVPGSKIFPNTPIQYRCNAGYTLIGPQVRVCQANGTWSGAEPVCQSGSGPTVCPAPGSILNGAVDLPPGALVANSKVQYRCNAGYTLVGQMERICQPDGSWSGTEPVCQAAAPVSTCPAPGPIANGAVDVPPGRIVVNTKVQYRCNAGYTLVGMTERICQADGSWSNTEPTCQASPPAPTTCPAPGPIANGAVDVPSGTITVNTMAQYRCNAGYTLIGARQRFCQSDGSWSGAEPTCQATAPATCPAPGPIANGAVDVPSGTITVNTMAQYRCNAGYTLIGARQRFCQADGSWSGAEPTCQASAPAPATCPAPGPIANGAVDVPSGTITVNTVAQYRCNAGYTLIGASQRFCQSDGSWSGAEPTCQANGAVDVPPGTITVIAVAQYRCSAGYTVIGARQRFCQFDGSRSGTEPVCQVVAAAVVLFMAYQFYLSREAAEEDAAALVPGQNVETKSAPLP